ncbi:MAG: Hsp33 family molecular chaperone HslO [Bdellovibrionota bacterium]
MRSDVLQKALSENGEAVIYALDATSLVQESLERLAAFPPATKHLGQSMMAALLLQALNDSDESESLSLQWMCEGPFGHLYAEARNFGEVRGTIREPQAPVTDYETRLGPGLLQVRRYKGTRGTTSIVNSAGDVSLDIVEYLEQSEQKNCGVNFSVVVDWADETKTKFVVRAALAYLVHVMPQPSEQKLNDALLRWNRQMESLGAISRWHLRSEEVTADMLRLITGEPEPRIVMTQRVTFQCNCNVDRALRALALLEAQEAKEKAPGSISAAPTQIRCEYCGKTYTIDPPGARPKAARKKPAPKKKPAAKKKRKK